MLIIYTGLGKGKTTAAVGAVIRSVGWKKRVALVQFVKHESWPSGEREVLRKLGVDVFVMGKSWVGIMGDKKEIGIHKKAAAEGIELIIKLINETIKTNKTNKLDKSGLRSSVAPLPAGLKSNKANKPITQYDLVVCDEILGALFGKLITKKDIENILNTLYKIPNTDLIFTGQNAPEWLIGKADLVTEMKKIKHPYDKGIIAKKGIDY